MTGTQRITFSTTIGAPVPVVWRTMLGKPGYEHWTSAFSEGSTYEGAWAPGAKIRFLGQEGDGIVSEIAEYREYAYISLRHLGFLAKGVEDTTSDAVRAWAPAYENYTFTAVPGGTEVDVELDMPAEWIEHMSEAWPKALALLAQASEAEAARG